MKNHLSYLLFLGLWCGGISLPALAQTNCGHAVLLDSTFVVTIHEAELPYHIRLIHKGDDVGRNRSMCYELQVRKNLNEEASLIWGDSDFTFGMGVFYPGIEFVDFNLDGYLDIAVPTFMSADGASKGLDIYLFEEILSSFVFNQEFSQIFSSSGFDIDVDQNKIEIISVEGCAGQCWSEKLYKIENGRLILQERRTESQSDKCSMGLLYTEKRLIDGKLVIVKDECI